MASFAFALIAKGEAARVAIAIIGGGVGGIAAGFLWTAQGAYFARSAKLYAAAKGVTFEEATTSFAALFGALFLGLELLLKLCPLGLQVHLLPACPEALCGCQCK